MHLSSKLAGLTAALALVATPAMGAAPAERGSPPPERGSQAQGKGLSTAPGQVCKGQSRKKAEGQAKSAFAACVLGAKRANREARAQAGDPEATSTAPGRLCRDQSRKKVKGQRKSAFAACVTGAAKAQERHEDNEEAAPAT